MNTTIVYLLHFDRPYRHARHYLGSTADLPARLASHRDTPDVRLLRVLKEEGIGFTLARTWPGNRKDERRMKGRGLAPLCPMCQVEKHWIKRDDNGSKILATS